MFFLLRSARTKFRYTVWCTSGWYVFVSLKATWLKRLIIPAFYLFLKWILLFQNIWSTTSRIGECGWDSVTSPCRSECLQHWLLRPASRTRTSGRRSRNQCRSENLREGALSLTQSECSRHKCEWWGERRRGGADAGFGCGGSPAWGLRDARVRTPAVSFAARQVPVLLLYSGLCLIQLNSLCWILFTFGSSNPRQNVEIE